MTLPVDVDATPNYTAAQHATHHNEIHAAVNDLSGSSVWTQIVNLPGTTLTGWTSLGGTWAANVGGYIEQTDTTAAYRGLRLDADVIVGSSLVVQAEMRFPSDATTDRRCMLSFAGEGTIASSHDPWVGLVENTDTLHVQRGNATALNTAFTVNEDVWYTVRGELSGWLLTISVNGAYQATYRLGGATATTEIQTNRLSLVTYQGPVHYRNIKAWRMVGPV